MDKRILNQFRNTINEKKLGVYGISVYKKGEGVITHRWRSNDKVNLYSASKTFTSMAVGIACDEGLLKLSDKIIDFFPEYKAFASNGTEKIEIRDLLHMASGKDIYWVPGEDGVNINTLKEDWAKLFLSAPMTWEPGTKFRYSNGCTYMLGRIIEKVSGAKNLRDFLVPKLFEPLEIYNPQWHMCPQGHTMCATELYLATEDLLKLGIMLLNEGEFEGKRIVSSDYVRAAHTDTIETKGSDFTDGENINGYGYQLWLCSQDGIYRADGMYSQFSIVVPEKEVVIAVTSHNEFNGNEIMRALWADLLPYM